MTRSTMAMTKDEAIRMLLRTIEDERAFLAREAEERGQRDDAPMATRLDDRWGVLSDALYAVEQGLGLSAAKDWR